MSVKVTGVRETVRAFDKLNVEMRRQLQGVVREGTENVANKARQRVRKRTLELHDTIRTEYTADGSVGWVKAGFGKLRRRSTATTTGGRVRASRRPRSEGAGVYAMVIEYGARDRPAHPFMRPSLYSERSSHRSRVEHAINAAQNTVAREAK